MNDIATYRPLSADRQDCFRIVRLLELSGGYPGANSSFASEYVESSARRLQARAQQ